MRELSRTIGKHNYDGLISGTNPPVQVDGRTIDALDMPTTLRRGTIMARSAASGKLFVLGATQTYVASQTYTGDGATDDFTVAGAPDSLTKVTVGGIPKTLTSDYTYTGGTLHFTAAPTGEVVAYYAATDTGIADCILTEEVEVGDADVQTTVYTAGCFDPAHCTVAEGYTMTAADLDALRKYGIVMRSKQEAR